MLAGTVLLTAAVVFYCSVTSSEKDCVTGKACQRSAAETSLDRRHLGRSHRTSPASRLPLNSGFGSYINLSLEEKESKALLFVCIFCCAAEDWRFGTKFICSPSQGWLQRPPGATAFNSVNYLTLWSAPTLKPLLRRAVLMCNAEISQAPLSLLPWFFPCLFDWKTENGSICISSSSVERRGRKSFC